LPQTLEKKHKLPKIESPGPDISKREMSELAAGRKFSFNLLPQDPTKEWMTIEVVDGKHKKNIIEIFDGLYSKKVCNCDQFFEEESGWCRHLAAFDGLEKQGWNEQYADVSAFKKALSFARVQIPMSIRLYRKGALFWDPHQGSQVVIGKIPAITENWKAYAAWNTKKVSLKIKAPKVFSSAGLLNNLTLFDYQEVIFQKMLNAKRSICSIVVGGGKTLLSIACYAHLKTVKKDATMLVIAPKSLCIQWSSEIKRATGLTALLIDKPDKFEKLKTEPGPFIVTYQYATKYIDILKKIKFDMVIVDEIQFVKNGDTKTWKGISQIKSEYFYGLSGTVIENRLDDLYSIMQIVNPLAVGARWKFNLKYQNITSSTKTKIIYSGVKNLEKLKEQLKDYIFFYNSLKLPGITHTKIVVTMNEKQKALHEQNYEQAKILIAKSMSGSLTFGEKAALQGYLLKTRQAAQSEELVDKVPPTVIPPLSNKMKEFETLLKKICINDKEKIVVFSEWTRHLKIAKRVADSLGIKYVFFTGEESAKKRDENVTLFKTDPDIQIFFSSDAGGVGLDGLQVVANNVVHIELPWNPSKLDQRTGRVHRFLQTKPVNAFYIMCKESIEDKIDALLDEKRETRQITLSCFL